MTTKTEGAEPAELGHYERTWVPDEQLAVPIRRVVDIELAGRGERHGQCADRAKVSASRWSRVVNADKVTLADIELLATGLGWTTARALSVLRGGKKESGNGGKKTPRKR